ncbi:putative spermidine/putrescine transport system ATP-binding protein [Bosea sp. OK403]|uniref:ABC transporter ATP-binding protein n=1 Tax=Bosea sp. OK403 TaxID=1855286 RepID=UPI0008F024F4|nr:ABC transporter ATP-binding protein [Bosea sp. OK403]SFJ73013.1 putative spermidine/putrescine transport system ATP-binding protein [Bosea sp. OK403]
MSLNDDQTFRQRHVLHALLRTAHKLRQISYPSYMLEMGRHNMSNLLVDRVSKKYGTVTALHETSLSVDAGEFLTLLGPSGSGKSTLLNLICGLIDPSSGRILIDDRDVTREAMNKRGLGMVFQNYALFPHMDVRANVSFPLKVRKFASQEIKKRVDDALGAVQLLHLADRKPANISGGQQQRVSLARALVYQPKLILLDEPLGALDKNLRADMQYHIKQLQRERGITMIYVTHDQEEALSMSDRVAILSDGRIQQIGTPSEIYFNPTSLFCAKFLGEANIFSGFVQSSAEGTNVDIDGNLLPASPGPLKDGDPADLIVRPENIIVSHDPRRGFIQAFVKELAMVGSTVKIRATARLSEERAQEITIQTLNRPHMPSFEGTFWFGWNREDATVIPALQLPLASHQDQPGR